MGAEWGKKPAPIYKQPFEMLHSTPIHKQPPFINNRLSREQKEENSAEGAGEKIEVIFRHPFTSNPHLETTLGPKYRNPFISNGFLYLGRSITDITIVVRGDSAVEHKTIW